MTQQRATTIWGPVTDSGPLWRATLGTAYAGKGPRPVVQKTHALRTLVQDANSSVIKVGGMDYAFHRPRLLQAAVEPRKDKWNQLTLGSGTTRAETVDLPDLSETAGLDDVLIAPVSSGGDWAGKVGVMETPPFYLVAGRIRVWIPLAARQNGDLPEVEPWLGYAKINGEHRLFTGVNGLSSSIDGLHVLTTTVSSKVYLPAELAPDGIAFFARVPDPLKAFDDVADKVWARVRLFETPKSANHRPRYALAFEGACEALATPTSWSFPEPMPDVDHAEALESGFASVFADAAKLGVRVDFDRRPAVPPFHWMLKTRDDASRPLFPPTATGWTCVFDEGLFRINVLSTIDGLPSGATLKCEAARLVIGRSSAEILLSSSAAGSGRRKIPLSRDHSAPHWRLGNIQAQSFAAARLPLAEVEKRLRALYIEANLVDPALDSIVPAFIPIEHGWLQVPLRASAITETPSIALSVLDGTAAFALDEERQHAIEVSAASASDLTLVIDKCSPPKCKRLGLALDDVAGRLRGLVHIADNSPSDGEILPRLRPGATREWPVLFGQGDVSNAIGVEAPEPALGNLALAVPPGEPEAPETLVLSWQRDGAWISTRNFAQAQGTGRPVAARSLVPRVVKSPFRLTRAKAGALPALAPANLGKVWDIFAAPVGGKADYETSQLQPALPGIERYGIRTQHRYSLRLDLPPLDDLFANMQIEDTPLLRLGQRETPVTGGMTALASAVAPGRLRDAWRRICDNDCLTRTRYRYAFGRVSTTAEVANLAMPFVEQNAPFKFDVDNGNNLPLGAYWLGGRAYAGATALAGLSMTLQVIKSGQAVDIAIVGNAAVRWSPPGSAMRYDVAGTGIDKRASLARPVEILTKPNQGETVELTTLSEPVDLEDDLKFWFRDLPMKGGVFDGRPGVDGVQGEVDARSAQSFILGLYEWRLWSSVAQRVSDIVLPHGFVARPLRLHRIAVAEGSVTRLELVASLVAPEALDASRESEAGETGPAQNLVLVTYVATAPRFFQRTLIRVKVVNEKIEPFTQPEIDAGLDRARFDLRAQVDLTRQEKDDSLPRDGTLTGTIDLDGALTSPELTLTLFGHPIVFTKPSAWSDGYGRASIDFLPPADGAGMIVLQGAKLAWEYDSEPVEPARFTAEPVLSLPFDGHDGAKLALVIDFGSSSVRWLGAEMEMSADIDHDKTAIWINGRGRIGSPVIGLELDNGGITALFAVLSDLKVSGFAQVRASYTSTEKKSLLMLAHAFQFVGNAWSSEMTLDLTVQGQSTIEWPVTVRAQVSDRPEDEAAVASTVAIQSGNALLHDVQCAIRGAAVPTEALTATGRLAEPWRLSMRADHRLSSPNGESVRWSSLDEVMIADLEQLSANARAGSTALGAVYGFGARYSGTYRGRMSTSLPDMLRPGLFGRELVAAGFPDELVEEALAGTQPSGIALFGAGVSLFRVDSGESFPLALPWLLGMHSAVLGPLAALRQAPSEDTKTWTTTWFDLRVGRVRNLAQAAPLTLGDPSAAGIASQIEMTDNEQVARPMLAAVEQPFFENPDGAIDIAEAPLFLRSLVTLAAAWPELLRLGNLQSRVVQPLVRGDGSCTLFATSLTAPRNERLRQLRLVCIYENTVALAPPRRDLDLKTVASATTAVLATLYGALEEPPLLFTLMSLEAFVEDGERPTLWCEIELAKRAITRPTQWVEPADSPLRDSSDRLFVSASLGWPEPPARRAVPAVPDALIMGENEPFQDEATAVSGRSASFASEAGGGLGQRPWITLRLQPNFDAMALPGVMAASPRQLDVVPRRPRLPAAPLQPNIVPSRFATVALGYRPGVAHLAMTALKEAGTLILDADDRPMACRASHHPVLAGQDRMPRATVLPAGIENLDWRRETFVLPSGAKCRLEQVPAIAFRTYAKDPDQPGDVPPPLALVVLKAANGRLDLARSPTLTLVNDGPTYPEWHPYTRRQFNLRIGTRAWPFKAVDGAGKITLTLDTAAAAEAAAHARGATGDTVIACELILSTSNTHADPAKPIAAPSLILQLPLTMARTTEPELTVPGATLIFGDPAYDRMLASMVASDTRRLDDDRLAILASDRQTYDLVSPILLSLGLKAPNGEIEHPDFKLSIQRFRESEEPTRCEFEIAKDMAVASLHVDLMIANGLKSVLPGDRLSLTAVFGANPYTLGLQLLITREPAVPPAPAVYHLLTLHGTSPDALDAATALSASGPTAEIIEYPALEADLMVGYVRRRGLFVWHFAPDVAAYYDRFGYLVKMDRSGAAQLPTDLADFEPAIAPPS